MQILLILFLLFSLLPFGARAVFAQTPAAVSEPPSAEVLMKRAAKFVEGQNYRFAVGDLNRVLRSDPNNVDALAMRGSAWTKLKEPDKAIEDLTSAIKLAPQDAALYTLRADALEAGGRMNEAKADRERVNELVKPGAAPGNAGEPAPVQFSINSPVAGPASVGAPENGATANTPAAPAEPPAVSVAQAATPEPAKPNEPGAPAVAQDPAAPKIPQPNESSEMHYQRGRDFLKQAKFGEAVAELDRAIAAQPNIPQYYNARGFAFYMLRDNKHALTDLNEAIRLNPSYQNAYVNRSNARKLAGDAEGSAADQAKARTLNTKR